VWISLGRRGGFRLEIEELNGNGIGDRLGDYLQIGAKCPMRLELNGTRRPDILAV
jgi:hypothetical protein